MKKILLHLLVLLSISYAATAQERCVTAVHARTSEYEQARPAAKTAIRTPKRAKASITVASGILTLRSSNCGQPSSSVVNTRLIIKQSGRNFFVRIPSGRVLRGQGNRNGFIARGQTVQNGAMVYEELRAGPIRSRKAKFTLSLSTERCMVVYGGRLNVGF